MKIATYIADDIQRCSTAVVKPTFLNNTPPFFFTYFYNPVPAYEIFESGVQATLTTQLGAADCVQKYFQ
jgi:hypothetical protein